MSKNINPLTSADNPATSRICPDCKQTLGVEAFGINKTQGWYAVDADGNQSRRSRYCKACESKRNASRSADRKAKFKSGELESPNPFSLIKCRTCGKNKVMSEYGDMPTNKNGKRTECRACAAVKMKASRQRRAALPNIKVESKVCTRCKKDLPASAFGKNKNNRDGLRATCKDCKNAAQNERKAAAKAKRQANRGAWTACGKCGELTPPGYFAYGNTCKACQNKYHADYNAAKPNSYLARKICDGIRRYMKNPPSVGNPYEVDSELLARVGITSLDDVRRHLEATMPAGYSWHDVTAGRLVIDHIQPLDSFRDESGDIPDHRLAEACGLNNLRLFPAGDNGSKGAKRDWAIAHPDTDQTAFDFMPVEVAGVNYSIDADKGGLD